MKTNGKKLRFIHTLPEITAICRLTGRKQLSDYYAPNIVAMCQVIPHHDFCCLHVIDRHVFLQIAVVSVYIICCFFKFHIPYIATVVSVHENHVTIKFG